jgi:hypothetical protein
MAKVWLDVLAIKGAGWGVTEAAITNFATDYTVARAALIKAMSAERNKVTTAECKTAFEAMVADMRDIKKRWFIKPPLTDADFASLLLDPPDGVRTSVGTPKAVAEADVSRPSVHVLELFIKAVAGSPVDPPGTDAGFRIHYGVMPSGGASPDAAMSFRRELAAVPVGGRDLPHSTFTRRHSIRFDFDEADSGKRAYFCIRIENDKGGDEGTGPWGPLFSAIIP